MKNKKPSKRLVLTVSAAVLFILGIGVLLFPTITKAINRGKTNTVVEDFSEFVADMSFSSTFDESEIPAMDESSTYSAEHKENARFTREQANRLYRDLYLYNKSLSDEGQFGYGDPFSFSDASINLNSYGIDTGIIGTISAPSISMKLPIYLGASEYNMLRGAAQLNRTSMPIGGDSTNCVIAAHRGMIDQTMFDNIVYLDLGDEVIITNYWEKLTYKVIDTKIIRPDDKNVFYIEEGRDLLTLFTCHPYGSNTHRYVVICERDSAPIN